MNKRKLVISVKFVTIKTIIMMKMNIDSGLKINDIADWEDDDNDDVIG